MNGLYLGAESEVLVERNHLSSFSDPFLLDFGGLLKDLGCKGFFVGWFGVSPVGDQSLFCPADNLFVLGAGVNLGVAIDRLYVPLN